ncbi:Formate dehydrogenase, nitrate-inducible, iron-sulfur subunit [subsurface metagenome]
MRLSRRDFLKLSAPAICLPVIYGVSERGLTETYRPFSLERSENAMLYDASKCIGCQLCADACWEKNGKSFTEVKSKWLDINGKEELGFYKHQCMHCTEATCVKVCPTGALRRHELGFVSYDRDKCSGCGYCVEFCPFQIPRLSGSTLTGVQKMDKCDFCEGRVANNQQPACVEACPVGALTFGDRDQLVAEGKERVEILRKTYPNATLFGENELGGLHVLLLLLKPANVYGLPEDPQVPLAATVWQDVTKPVGFALGGLSIIVLAVNYLIARQAKLTREPVTRRE